METRAVERNISPVAYISHSDVATDPFMTPGSTPTMSSGAGITIHPGYAGQSCLPTPRGHPDAYRSSVPAFVSTMWQRPRSPSPEHTQLPSSSRLMLPPVTASPDSCFNLPDLAFRSPSCSPTHSPPPSPTDSFIMRSHSSSTLSGSSDATLPSIPLTPPDSDSTWGTGTIAYDDSLPSPPRTLKDQVQNAYALDNIHLAKVLLLKLRGIEVTSDDDPRIAQVKDSDFNSVFIPPGGLRLSPEDEERYREGLRREKERRRRFQRQVRLRACEKVWEESVRCLREEKNRVLRRKEEEMRERRRLEIEARERKREAREKESQRDADILARYTRQLRVSTCSNQRTRLSYGSLPISRSAPLRSPPPPMPTFEYALMPQVHALTASRPAAYSLPKNKSPLSSPHRAFKELSALSSQNVSFHMVVTRMHGPLFPEDDDDDDDDGTSSVRRMTIRTRTVAQVQLFDDLLKRDVSQWEERTSPRPSLRVVGRRRTTDCPACSLSLSSTTAALASTSAPSGLRRSSTRPSHSNSWFSSISSILSTPSLTSSSSVSSTSSLESPLTPTSSSPLAKSSSVIPCSSSSIPASSSPQKEVTDPVHTLTYHHTCPHSRLISLSPTDSHPLSPSLPSSPSHQIPSSFSPTGSLPPTRTRSSTIISNSTVRPHAHARRPSVSPTPTQGEREGEGLVRKMSRGLSRFIDLAAEFQKAYVRAAMFSAGSDLYSSSSRSRSRSPSSASRSRSRHRHGVRGAGTEEEVWASRGRRRDRRRRSKLRPVGNRVSSTDVQIFLSISPEYPSHSETSTRPLLPLHALPSSSSPTSPALSSTSLISSFSPHSHPPHIPPRSPYRPQIPPHTLTPRYRHIPNPLLLRKKAARNSLCADVDVRTDVRVDVGLRLPVKERLVGVAWDGIGRSGLGWEVSVR